MACMRVNEGPLYIFCVYFSINHFVTLLFTIPILYTPFPMRKAFEPDPPGIFVCVFFLFSELSFLTNLSYSSNSTLLV